MHTVLKIFSVIGEIGFWILLVYIAYQLFRFEKHLKVWSKLNPESIIISQRTSEISTILLRMGVLGKLDKTEVAKELYKFSYKGYTEKDLEIVGLPTDLINQYKIVQAENIVESLKQEAKKDESNATT